MSYILIFSLNFRTLMLAQLWFFLFALQLIYFIKQLEQKLKLVILVLKLKYLMNEVDW